jgi:hypothetical protein
MYERDAPDRSRSAVLQLKRSSIVSSSRFSRSSACAPRLQTPTARTSPRPSFATAATGVAAMSDTMPSPTTINERPWMWSGDRRRFTWSDGTRTRDLRRDSPWV